MLKILHITPHLGGGVGRVLLAYLVHALTRDDESHRLVALEYANETARRTAAERGLYLRDRMFDDRAGLAAEISRADVVAIHWWNHPLLCALMVNEVLPPARVAVWSHVSGHAAPQIFTRELTAYPDLFVVASPYSFETPVIRDLTPVEREARVRLVFSCAGTDHIGSVKPIPHQGFRVGYVGTVDYCKMHRDFIAMSAGAKIPDAVFVVCGGPNHEEIRAEAVRAGVGGQFDFRGHVDDVAGVLASLDVFGYPLAATHYGTGEQTLIEALAAGVPPVVLDNGAESHVIENGRTGLVAADPVRYAECLELLAKQPDFRRELGENARQSAKQRFDIARTAEGWREIFDELMRFPKKSRAWPGNETGGTRSPAELFVASLGDQAGPFRNGIEATSIGDRRTDEAIAGLPGLYRARTRGSVFHYRSFFPGDPRLNYWCALMLARDGLAKESETFMKLAESAKGEDSPQTTPIVNGGAY